MLLGGANGGAKTSFVGYFSRKCALNMRKINPSVPPQEASSLVESLYYVIKQHGPRTVSNTWSYAKEAGIGGLAGKTHMKIMLKWMRGKNMLKLFWHHVGSSKNSYTVLFLKNLKLLNRSTTWN